MHARMHPSLIARRDCTVLKYSVFNDRRPVKVFQSVFFTGLLIFRFASTGDRIYNVNKQKSLEWMPLHIRSSLYTVSITRGLRTTDCGLSIKHGLGKMWTTDYVG